MLNSNSHIRGALATFTLCLSFMHGVAEARIGKVVTASGEVMLKRATLQPLVKDAILESGDVLITGANGTLEAQMDNGESVSLRPGTEFVIDEFTMPVQASQPWTGRSFYRLLKGGLRAVTASLGRRGLDSYRITTPVATMGIRGTILTAALNNGLYVGVEQGVVAVANQAGTLLVNAGQFAFTASATAAPGFLAVRPEILSSLSGGGGAGAGAGGGAAAGGAEAGAAGAAGGTGAGAGTAGAAAGAGAGAAGGAAGAAAAGAAVGATSVVAAGVIAAGAIVAATSGDGTTSTTTSSSPQTSQ